MGRMGIYAKKSLKGIFWLMEKVDNRRYRRLYPRYLKWLGVRIEPDDTGRSWISPKVFLDSDRYDYIEIGTPVTISFDVAILVHDVSVIPAARSVGKKTKTFIHKKVKIGNNVFIGARSVILPGSTIGDNCIVGAGTVVHGHLEENSIYAGNPCRKIGNVKDFVEKHKELLCE